MMTREPCAYCGTLHYANAVGNCVNCGAPIRIRAPARPVDVYMGVDGPIAIPVTTVIGGAGGGGSGGTGGCGGGLFSDFRVDWIR